MAATSKAMPANLLSVRLMTIARSLPVLPCQPGFPKLQKNEMRIGVSSPGSWEVGFSGCRPKGMRVPHPHGVPRAGVYAHQHAPDCYAYESWLFSPPVGGWQQRWTLHRRCQRVP